MESERAVERTERNLQIIKQRMSRIEEQTSKKRRKMDRRTEEYPSNPRIKPAMLIDIVATVGSSGLVANFPKYP